MTSRIENYRGEELQISEKGFPLIAESFLKEHQKDIENLIHEKGYSLKELESLTAEQFQPIAEELMQALFSKYFRN